MNIGFWITILIILFILGSIMGLKPSGVEQRLDKVRMAARKLGLNPKLVACPKWIIGKNQEYGHGMMGQYGIIIDGASMPHVRYHPIDNMWRPATTNNDETTADFSLDKQPINLPKHICALVTGLEAKSNNIVLYWNDKDYIRPENNPNFSIETIEKDLQAMDACLRHWATLIADGSKTSNKA